MESSNKILISNILPFMNQPYFETLLKNEKLGFKEIKIRCCENLLPSKIIFKEINL